MASSSSRARIDQFFAAKKRKPSSLNDEMSEKHQRSPSGASPCGGAKGNLDGYLIRSPAAAPPGGGGSPRCDVAARRSLSAAIDQSTDVPVAAEDSPGEGGGKNCELKKFATDFLSLYCSDVPGAAADSNEVETKKQKRRATPSFLVSCDEKSVKKQCISGRSRLETLKGEKSLRFVEPGTYRVKELSDGLKESNEGFMSLRRCSVTPTTVQRKVGPGETPKSVSRNSMISPGEEFWNAAIEIADGVFAPANDGHGRVQISEAGMLNCDGVEDKSSCAVAMFSKTLARSRKDDMDCQSIVGCIDLKQIEKLTDEVEPAASNTKHNETSPLPVKHLDFFHEDEIPVCGSKGKTKDSSGTGNTCADQVHLKDIVFQRLENMPRSGDHIKKFNFDTDHHSSLKIAGQDSFKTTIEGNRNSCRAINYKKDSLLNNGNDNQLNNNEDESHNALSRPHRVGFAHSQDTESKFASQEVDASTPTSYVPPKDHSKLSSWLPPELCRVYMEKGILELYPWQVECLLVDGVLEKRNLVYCASTSAGKSFVAEILMLRRIISTSKMALLVLPYVSICTEKAEHLERLLEPLGRHVRSFYGNQGGGSLPKDTSVAVCTIEKANSLVNKLLEDGWLSELSIIVIDELHMVGDQHRGYLLELMLTKLRYAAGEGNSESSSGETSGSSSGKASTTHGLQIVGMSATMPNVAAVADWLQAALYQTDFRPVPLEEFIKVGNKIFDKEMNVVRIIPKVADLGGKDPDHIVELCNEVVQQGHSVLLFCSSRKGCESTARHVAKFLKIASVGSGEVGSEVADTASAIEGLRRCPAGLDSILEETLPFGVAYHHAGLTVEEREIVETCYRKGLVRVLTATSTLAAGVNLPARRVIFRQPRIGRDFIDGTRYRQMAGRAGRTGIDTKGESILVCKPEEVKRIMGILRSNCPPLQSCLSEDKNGMTHAIMEVVAGGIVQTASDIHRYVRCTLLNSTKPFDDVVKSAQDSLRWLCHKKFLEWSDETKLYSTTPLGRASFGSSLNPEESLVVLDDLSRAREGFILASDLHLVYLVTPINVDVEPDWELYYERFVQLSALEQSVGNRVGVVEPFLMKMAHGAVVPVHRKQPQRKSGMYDSSRAFGADRNVLINEQTLRVSKRFYVALMLSRLVQEIPVADVCEAFKVARGMIQALQENAGRFASMVSVFCQRLGWHDLEGLVARFQNRVSFGVRAEIAELTSIPFVKGSRARALYKAGLRTPLAIAEASIPEIAKALFECSTWSGQDDSGLRRMQLGVAKKIKTGARKIVLEEAEAARVAAFSAFRSLGVNVPQFGTPLLPGIEVSPDEAEAEKSRKLAAGATADGKSNGSDCTAQMVYRDSLGEEGAAQVVYRDSLGEEGAGPRAFVEVKEYRAMPHDINIVADNVQEEASPSSIQVADKLSGRIIDKGPTHARNFPGGFDCFLDQWSAVREFSFNLHFLKRSHKLSGTYFEVIGLALCWENSPIYYCGFGTDLFTVGNSDSCDVWAVFRNRWNRIADVMRENSARKMTWNLKIQIQALKFPCISSQRFSRLGLDHKKFSDIELLDSSYVLLPSIHVYNGFDISLMAWILWPDEESKTAPNLEKLVKRRLHSEAAAAANRDGRWRNQMHKAAHDGCCRRVAQTRALGSVLGKLLVSENLTRLVEIIECPLVNVLADMELCGIGVDMDACLHARHILIRKLKELENEAHRLAGRIFSLHATADIANVLYTHLKLPVPKGCEKGRLHPSTDKRSLDQLRGQHPIIPVIKEYRTLAKLLNSTLGSICSRAQYCTQSQRYLIQGNWLQTSTATGRLSMEEPNLQCVEHLVVFRTGQNDQDKSSTLMVDHHEMNARNFFIPTQDNWLFVAADYSQIELRLMAHFSKDPTLVELLSKPEGDVFKMIAARWTGKEESSICSQERENTKRLIYGILYGMGANSLAEQLECSSEEAAKKIQSFKSSFPAVSSWLHEAVAFCRQKGYVETLMGRRRFLTNITAGNCKEKAKAQRQAVNSICQGSAADIIKVAMITVHSVITDRTKAIDSNEELRRKFSEIRGRCRLVLQVHDELVLEVDPCILTKAARLLQISMTNAASLLVPLHTKLKVGKTWGSLEPFQTEPL